MSDVHGTVGMGGLTMANEKRLIDLTGQRFGKLVVISRESKYHRNATWRCICDCGKETVVRGDVLCRGTTQSCGCGKGLKHGHFMIESRRGAGALKRHLKHQRGRRKDGDGNG